MEAGVSMTGVDILSKEKQIQKYVPHCRNSRQKRPVDSSEEVDQIVEMCKGNEKQSISTLQTNTVPQVFFLLYQIQQSNIRPTEGRLARNLSKTSSSC